MQRHQPSLICLPWLCGKTILFNKYAICNLYCLYCTEGSAVALLRSDYAISA